MIFEDTAGLIKSLSEQKRARIITLTIVLVLSISALFLLIKYAKVKEQKRSEQLSLQTSKINFIDSQLNMLYRQSYMPLNDSSEWSESIKNNYFDRINFLKKERAELDKKVEEINKEPILELLIPLISSLGLLLVLIRFFLSSFKISYEDPSKTIKDEINRLKKSKDEGKENYEFINWLISEEIYDYKGDFDIDKAKKYKEVYDLSNQFPEQKQKLLSLIAEIVDLTRVDEQQVIEDDLEINVIFEEIQYRLKAECGRLNKQAVLNLFLSSIIILSLVFFMGYSNFFWGIQQGFSSFENFLISYLPKVVSIVSLLTVFFYFIRLYKTNILDVKYYQNELTNIELKQMALRIAIAKDDGETINYLIKEVLKTERNQVFGKEQTSIDLERQKMENEINKSYLDKTWEMMSSIFNMKKDK